MPAQSGERTSHRGAGSLRKDEGSRLWVCEETDDRKLRPVHTCRTLVTIREGFVEL